MWNINVSLHRSAKGPENGGIRDYWKTEGLSRCHLRNEYSKIHEPRRLIEYLDLSDGNDDASDNSYHLFSADCVLGLPLVSTTLTTTCYCF